VAQLGTRLHALVDRVEGNPERRVRAALEDAGVRATIGLTRASLEDVFVAATRSRAA